MFQLDRGDLDFGLYRIMNLKAAEIEGFLENDLLPQVKTVLAGMADDERAALYGVLAEAREAAWELGVDPDEAPKVVELKQKLAEAKADAAAEADVYNHLANFFARYYAEGDFISQRRYSSRRPLGLSHPLRRRGSEAALGQSGPVLRQVNRELRLLYLHRGHGRRGEARPLRNCGGRQRKGQHQGNQRQAAPLSVGE